MLSTVTETGVVYAGETSVKLTPKFPFQPEMPGVAFVHGAGSGATYLLDPYGRQAIKTLRIGSRYPAISGDMGGDQTWGNDLSITRLGGYLTTLANRPDANNNYALVGDSMGGLISLNYAAQAATKPKAMVLTIPVINPEDIRANNRSGYASLINAAYGGAYNEGTMGASKNPYTMRDAAKLKNIPMLIFYGANDQLCLPTFATGFIASDPEYRTGIALPYGHEEAAYSNVNHTLVMEFLKEHLG